MTIAEKALNSRKAWAFVLVLVAVLTKKWTEISADDLDRLLTLAGAYIAGQGFVDGLSALRRPNA